MDKKKDTKSKGPKGTRLADDRRRTLPKKDKKPEIYHRIMEEEDRVELEEENPRDEEPGEVP